MAGVVIALWQKWLLCSAILSMLILILANHLRQTVSHDAYLGVLEQEHQNTFDCHHDRLRVYRRHYGSFNLICLKADFR